MAVYTVINQPPHLSGHNPRLQLAYPGTITSLYITPCSLRYELSELSTTNLEFSNFSEALNPPDSVAVVVVVLIKTGEKNIAIFESRT